VGKSELPRELRVLIEITINSENSAQMI
jgi:hypothetical protein